MKYDVIVIGAGAAGMTAALYALRNGKTVLVLERESFGGQISNSPRVENFPSIKQISGSEFSDNLFNQIIDLGAEFELETVENIEKVGEGDFLVKTDYATHEGRSVIIAAGVKHRHFGLPREEELIGKGISFCALCDGAFYAGEEVVLVGDANTALQYALLLSNSCKKVKVMTLFDKFFADGALVKALRERENIEVTHEVSLVEFIADDELKGLVFKRKDGSTFNVETRALFVAIGQVPDNKVFANVVNLDKFGYIIADETCSTKTPGIYVAGDCRTKKVRQLTTACNDGAIAATNASIYIDTL